MSEDQSTALVLACRQGERQAFDKLIGLYEKPVFNVVLRMLADYEEARDVTQTVFMKAFENLDSYDDGRKFFSWIYRIAINESINHQASRRSACSLDREIGGRDDTEREAGRNQIQQTLEDALMRLSAEQRSVVVLKHLLGFGYREISEILAVPEKTVKSRLYDGRERLRGLLNREALL